MGEEKESLYMHALDIMMFIRSATIRMMTIDVLVEDNLLAKMRFEFSQDTSNTTNHDLYHIPPLFKH